MIIFTTIDIWKVELGWLVNRCVCHLETILSIWNYV